MNKSRQSHSADCRSINREKFEPSEISKSNMRVLEDAASFCRHTLTSNIKNGYIE